MSSRKSEESVHPIHSMRDLVQISLVTYIVQQEEMAVLLVKLFDQSMWFQVMPLPFDEWEVTVKKEAVHVLVSCFEQVP